ncbi:MAG: hypothetical protein F6K35_25695, partial [Okeania sp. SIO2H7]|nr:hypothetical protein [Okeania sp. SIO2H7]
PNQSNNYYLLGKILEEQQQWKEAIKVYEKGLKRLPAATKLAMKLERLLKRERSPISDYYEQGMLSAKQNDFEKALLCYQELLKTKSNCEELGIALVKGGKLREVIDIYHQIFNKNLKNLDFYCRFSIRLSEEGLLKQAVAFFEERPKVKTRHLEAGKSNTTKINSSIYDDILTWLNEKNAPQFNLDLDLDKLESQAVEIERHFQQKNLQVLEIDNLSTTDKKKLKELGISLEYVKLINVENDALENIYINPGEAKLLNQPRKRTKIYPHRQLNCFHRINKAVEYPHTIAEFQYMYAVDPMTGKVLKTNESFYLGKRNIVYRFVGKEVFYIQTGYFESAKISLYVPKFNLVLSWYKIKINVRTHQKFYNTLNAYLVAYFKDVRKYLNSCHQRRVTLIVNCIKNLGHFFWQEVNGIYYLEKNQLLEKVDYFALGDYEPMKIASVIPEVPENKILKIPDMSASKMFRFLLKNNCFCARVVEHFMTEDYLSRIYNVAKDKCSEDFLKMLNAIREKKETFPLIWLNVRSHNKSWVSQVHGLANIINKLTESFPNLGIVFDGWIDCNEVVENILKLVKTELKVYNTLGCPLHESIMWADRIDAYIGVVGSGLVITSWLSNKPGVAYSNLGHLRQERFWSKVKEDAIAPIFLKPDEITPIEDNMYGNYEIDWEVIYEKILGILQQV